MTLVSRWIGIPVMALLTLSAAELNKSVYIGIDFTLQPFPTYGYGRLVAVRSDHLTVMATRRDGTLAYSNQIRLAEPSVSQVYDAAIEDSGRVAVVASLKRQSRGFRCGILWLDPFGKVERIVETAPFVPSKVYLAKDGKLWAVGKVRDEKEREIEGEAVRIYDASGRELRRFYPLTGKTDFSRMLPTERGMAVLIPQQNRYVEFGEEGQVLRSIDLPQWPVVRAYGFAHTPKGEVILQAQWRKGETEYPGSGGTLIHDPERNVWSEAGTRVPIGRKELLGDEGKDGLVMYDHGAQALQRIIVE